MNNPWVITIIGGAVVLILGKLVLNWFRNFKEYRKINKKATIQKGITFSFNKFLINLKVGKIQEISNLDKNSAVVLPANTTFIDDCITDEKSAPGAFFLKFYSGKISKAPEDINEQLEKQGYQKDKDDSYPPGTTIMLPQEYDIPAKCLISASTIRRKKIGIRAHPSIICECIQQIFEITADKKIERLYMPVLGSGHGGLDINDAVLFLLLALKYYSKLFHHVKSIDIIVTENDTKKLRDIYRLQYLTLLEEVKK